MIQMLTRLKLARIREIYDEVAERAAQQEWGYRDYLRHLLEEELLAREENQMRRRLRRAAFPFEKTVEQFDFVFRPELKQQVFRNYLDPCFVHQGRTLVFIGPPGVGKTHLSVSIGLKMIGHGFDVRFVTVQSLVNKALGVESQERKKVLRPLLLCDLLILDEFGYLPADPGVGPLLYELVAGRYEHKATVVTSNKSLPEWGRILGDTALAAALIDRLVHHGEVYYFEGESYRVRGREPGARLSTKSHAQARGVESRVDKEIQNRTSIPPQPPASSALAEPG